MNVTSELSGEVLAAVTAWLPANDVEDRPQIQLATVDAEGRPDIRTVLLSSWGPDGFCFHTDAASRKHAQLAVNPAVAIEFLWPGFTRQLVVRGFAELQGPAALAEAFARRSPYLKQLAWQNSTEFAQLDHEDRVARWAAFAREHDVEALGPSPTWTGYLVRPDRLTFWESDEQAASHREEYRAAGGSAEGERAWSVHHLAG